MTDLGKDFRQRLGAVRKSRAGSHRRAALGRTARASGYSGSKAAAIEMVVHPGAWPRTAVISSQVGCTMDCTFCSTAQQGFNRNARAAEIVGQVWLPTVNWATRRTATA